jgi:NTP pyrophosphatase (non-canonical NTP hydrolase)
MGENKMSELDLYIDNNDNDNDNENKEGEEINSLTLRKAHDILTYSAHKYQQEAARTLIDEIDFELTDLEMHILWNSDGLAGEVGEWMNRVKKAIWHRKGVEKLQEEESIKELGDICWYLAGICTSLGISLGDVMQQNIEKLKKRFPDGYDVERTPDIG